MRKRNLYVRVNGIGFYANGLELWYRCRVFANDAAPDTYDPRTEIGGWHRNLTGQLHPVEVSFMIPIPERFVLEVEKTVKHDVMKSYCDLLAAFNPS